MPLEGFMVPERNVSESTCLNMTVSPKQTLDFSLLSDDRGTSSFVFRTVLFRTWSGRLGYCSWHFPRLPFLEVYEVRH